MTDLGEYLQRKSANKAEIARRTGISKARITELSNNETTRLTAKELYLIILAVDDNPGEVFNKLFANIKLKVKA
ncbi:MAG: helix-turn-helix transcriptional regulator [Bacteroidota bacterium]